MKLPLLSIKIIRAVSLLCTLAVGAVCARAQTIHTFAGNGSATCGTAGVPATMYALTSNTNCIAIGAGGNIYMGTSYQVICINTSGTVSSIAGHCGYLGYSGISGLSGDGGPATAALLGGTRGIAVDGLGNVYFSDATYNRYRKINTAGIITAFAGNGITGFSGDGGPATAASLRSTGGVAVDASGNVYIGDGNNHRIRKINTAGIISTFAGNGTSGHSGDGGPAMAAAIGIPCWMAFDGAGNLYFTDLLNNLVRKISPSGTISAVAGTGMAGYSGDGGPATAASLNGPLGIALDGAGNIYVSQIYNHCVRRINTAGIISTYAGNGTGAFGGDGGPATAAMLRHPYGLTTDGAGNLYIVDRDNYRVRIVQPASTPAFDGGSPQSLTVCANSLANPINSLLTVTDPASWLTETFTVTMAPVHGAITTGSTVASGTSSSPTGWAYTPATGYSGTDSFTIQVANGTNTAATIIYVTVNPLPVPGVITGTPMLCVGSSAAFSDAAPGGVWTSAATGIVSLSGSAGTAITVTGVATGTDTVYYTVTNSCGTAAAYAAVTVNPLPDAGVITGTGIICVGATATFSDAAPGGVWTSAAAGIVSLSGSAGATITVTGIAAGIDTVYYTVTNFCGTAIAAYSITVAAPPVVPPIMGPSLICNDVGIDLTDSLPGGVWSSSNTTIATVSTTGHVNGAGTGVDTIFYTVTTSCGTSSAMHIVTVNTVPLVTSIIGPYTVCAGSSATFTDTTAGGTWAASSHYSAFASGTLTATAPGYDTLMYSVTNICGTTTVSHVVQIIDCDTLLGTAHVSKGTGLSVFPNPSDGTFTITLPDAANHTTQIVVNNTIGEKIKEITVAGTTTTLKLDVPAGIYFISAFTEQGRYNANVVVVR